MNTASRTCFKQFMTQLHTFKKVGKLKEREREEKSCPTLTKKKRVCFLFEASMCSTPYTFTYSIVFCFLRINFLVRNVPSILNYFALTLIINERMTHSLSLLRNYFVDTFFFFFSEENKLKKVKVLGRICNRN